jgi:hypothetical protein
MTKVLARVDSAATRGARKQSVQARASTLKASPAKGQPATAPKVTISHERQSGTITIRSATIPG